MKPIVQIITVLALAMLVLNVFVPSIQAIESEKGQSRSGQVVEINEDIEIYSNDGFDYTQLMNLANSSDMWLNNYNQTIKPFMNDNPDIKGIMVYPYFAPLLFNATFTDRDITVAGFIRMEPSVIMDGASEFWIRVPVFNLTDDVTVTLRMYRVLDPVNFDVNFTDVGQATFATTQMQMVCNYTYDKNADLTLTVNDPIPYGYDNQVIQHSTDFDYWENQWWNTTWVKVSSALFPNENYFIQFDLVFPVGEKAGELQLAVSQEDFCADNNYNTWLYVNGTSHFLQADLDMSMILTYGISNGITGIGNETYFTHPDNGEGNFQGNYNASIPIKCDINKRYFEMVMPLLWNKENNMDPGWLSITFELTAYSSTDDSVPIAHTTFQKIINQTYSFVVHDWDLNAYSGQYIDHVRINLNIPILYAHAITLWAYQMAGQNATDVPGFTDVYSNTASPTDMGYVILDKYFYVPYGYYGLSSSYWNATSYNLVVIPISTPNTPNEIVEAIHRFQAYVTDGDGDGKLITVEDIAKFLKEALSYAISKFIDAVITFYSFVIGNIIDFFFGEGTADWLWDSLIAIGQWIKEMVLFLIDAFEWFVYWAVRTIYSISVVIVYLLNVFGVISINSALLAYAKTGKSRDFVKAFRAGWNFVWAIISFLISGLILAVSIIGAVVPF